MPSKAALSASSSSTSAAIDPDLISSVNQIWNKSAANIAGSAGHKNFSSFRDRGGWQILTKKLIVVHIYDKKIAAGVK